MKDRITLGSVCAYFILDKQGRIKLTQLASMFYIGYLVFQFPFGFLLQHLPTGRLLSATVVAWGCVLITTPACKSFAGIATNRFFLGALESAINPGFVLLMSMW